MNREFAYLVFSLIWLMTSQAFASVAETEFDLNIPEAKASVAVKSLARQTGYSVIFRSVEVENFEINSLVGRYTVQQALDALFHGTELSGGLTEGGVITVSRKPMSKNGRGNSMINKEKKLSLLSKAALLIFGVSSLQTINSVNAQDGDNTRNKPLEEIIVKGVAGSLSRALDLKRDSQGFTDAIVAEDLAEFPDLNISESLQRIPGISLSRTFDGEGAELSIRGLGPEFIRTTIAGMTVVSDNAARNVEFDVFASELFSTAVVAKTPAAEYTEGGIGGTIDLQTPRPFDLGEFKAVASARAGYHDLTDTPQPRISGLVGGMINDTLGAVFSASYSKTHQRSDLSQGFRFVPANFDVNGDGFDAADGDTLFSLFPRIGIRETKRERIGLTGTIQFQPDDQFDFVFDALYARLEDRRDRNTFAGALFGNVLARGQPANIAIDNTGTPLVTSALFPNTEIVTEIVDLHTDSTFLLLNAEGHFVPNENWDIKAKIAYSDGKQRQPLDQPSGYQAFGFGNFFYDLNIDGDFLYPTLQFPGFDINDTRNYPAGNLRIRHDAANNDADEFLAGLDLERQVDFSVFRSFKVGAEARLSETTREQFRARLSPMNVIGRDVALSEVAGVLAYDDFGSGNSPLRIFPVFDIDNTHALFASNLTTSQLFDQGFEVSEDVYAFYGQGNIDWGRLTGNVGVRVAVTDQKSAGSQFIDGALSPIQVSRSYTDVLPSINLRYELRDDIVIRASGSRAIARPTLSDLSPGRSILTPVRQVRTGNPELNPFKADQFDIGIEWYFAEDSVVSAAFYFKSISGFITDVTENLPFSSPGLTSDMGENLDGAIFAITKPINGGDGELKGIELSYQQPFSFLPAPLNHSGILANYTYSDSKGDIDLGSGLERRGLPGSSKHSYNIIGYYETDTFSVRAAYSWRDDFIDSFRSGRELTNASTGYLDASLNYEVNDHITLRAEALNLTSEDFYRFDEQFNRNVIFFDNGRTFQIGVQYSF